jgi:membrane-associated protease RseP (regulator of RpoE activity)
VNYVTTQSLLIALLAALVGYPLLVLAHELGHAIVAIAYGRSAEAAAGDGESGARFTVGRLTVSIEPFPRGGYCRYDSNGLTVRKRQAVLLGGPIASFCVALGLTAGAYLASDTHSPLFWVLAAGATVAAIQAGATAWPRKHGSRDGSDGAQLHRLRSFSPYYVPPRREGERSICRTGPARVRRRR